MNQTDDPFAALEAAARGQESREKAAKAIETSIVRGFLIERSPDRAFFTVLVTKHQYQPAPDGSDIDTAATDGETVTYNPEFVNSLSAAQLVGLLAHEALHPGFGHHARRNGRDPQNWNISADLEINPVLRDAGYTLPPGALFPGEGQFRNLPKGMTAEDYYNLLPAPKPNPKGQNGQGKGNDPGRCGGVLDAGDEAEQQSSQADWKVSMAAAAAAAKERGELPAGLGRLVDQLLCPKVKWEDALADFVQRSLMNRDNYSWSRPNKRYIAQGIYLPSLIGEELPEIVVAVDTSGSIGQELLNAFAGELNGILECNPSKVTILYCDAAIQRVQEWNPGDGPLTLQAAGGGGTSHVPVWQWLREQDSDPVCVVALTDGYTDFGNEPTVPVLWALTPGSSAKPPFGSVVSID